MVSVALFALVGFFTVGNVEDRAMFFDPEGRPFYLRGCGTVNKALDHAPELLRRCGFNAVAQPAQSMRGRGFAWTYNFNVGRRFMEKGPDFVRRNSDGHGFPNVNHPDFERFVSDFIKANMGDKKDEPMLLGYFIDNELAFDMAKPEEIERYFAVTSRAIREADPNHMLLGCRFMGGKTSSDAKVWEECGKVCDVVSVNIYPKIDLYRRRIYVHDVYFGGDGHEIDVVDLLPKLSARCQRPVIVTEWSFPALDTPFPNTVGGGCRVDTQDDRARASALFVMHLYSIKCLPGYFYFRWYDCDSWSKERTNYGLVSDDGEPYEQLVKAFEKVQGRFGDYFGKPPPKKREWPSLPRPFGELAARLARPGAVPSWPDSLDFPRESFTSLPISGRRAIAVWAKNGKRPKPFIHVKGTPLGDEQRWLMRYKPWPNDACFLEDGSYFGFAAPPQSDYASVKLYMTKKGTVNSDISMRDGEGCFGFLVWGRGGRREYESELSELRRDWEQVIAFGATNGHPTVVETSLTRSHGALSIAGDAPCVEAKTSPDGRNRIEYNEGSIMVSRDGKTLFGPQPISMSLDRGEARVELVARDDGVAYRFVSDVDGEITVNDETCALVFPSADTEIWAGYNWCDNPKDPKQDKLQHGCASIYTKTTPGEFAPDGRRIAYLPLTVRFDDGTTVLFSESDLRDYAGLHLRRDGGETRRLDGMFGRYPVREKEWTAPRNYRRVRDRENWIVKTAGRRTFPWRVFAIASTPAALMEQRLVYDLASPSQGDFSWVKTGPCAWDWWSKWHLDDVPFNPGVNTETYMHYADFAAEFGLSWMLVDEGWKQGDDLYAETPGFDLDAILSHAAVRNVRVMLWTAWRSIDGRQDEYFRHFAKRGVKGFKIDFMERDDAEMMCFMEETLNVAAKYRLCIDFHGCGKPTGLERTYPNLVGIEGVHGLELMKLSFAKDDDFPAHDCQVAFTRAPLGMVDYTPGAMMNRTRGEWRPNNENPASQGTRVHQMALYTMFPVPLQMLCDSPSRYRMNPDCTRFIASVPTVWDETKGLAGEIGKFAVVARRKGDEWWAGAITDWSPRTLALDTSFLGSGEWNVEIFCDAEDSASMPERWARRSRRICAGEKIQMELAPGGGWTARFSPISRHGVFLEADTFARTSFVSKRGCYRRGKWNGRSGVQKRGNQ